MNNRDKRIWLANNNLPLIVVVLTRAPFFVNDRVDELVAYVTAHVRLPMAVSLLRKVRPSGNLNLGARARTHLTTHQEVTNV